MRAAFVLAAFCIFLGKSSGTTLYEYYAPGGVVSEGLVAEGPSFTLNGKDITIISGSLHYFRVHPDYWRDTFKKMRAAGLNTIQTYTPWNLHEPRMGEFDFGSLGEDMSAFLDVRTFVQMAQEEDLFVIFRPGPYICSEWEFGGLPSWLLRDHTMHVRSSYANYKNAAVRYLDNILPLVSDLEFTNGGPIIAVQIENEYGNFGWSDEPRDLLFMEALKNATLDNGFTDTLLFTSDSPAKALDWGALPGILQTANFKDDPEPNLDLLQKLQPNRPMYVAEFWTGWFDHWLANVHDDWTVEGFASVFEYILQRNSSVNMYMFIGGTNFGFMAGANVVPNSWPHYAPIVSSYDYGAPLSEGGDYTEKFSRMLEILSRLNPLYGIVDNPALPAERTKTGYGSFPVTEKIDYRTLINQLPNSYVVTGKPVNMEALPHNNGNGQSYGYTLYSTSSTLQSPQSELRIRGHVRDMAQVLVDDSVVTTEYQNLQDISTFGYWNARDATLNLTGSGAQATIDILVENLGRVNYGTPEAYVQKKGLWEGPVLLDNDELTSWTISPIEFKQSFINGLTGWSTFAGPEPNPSLYRATVSISPVTDTFLDMSAWGKGVVFLNGFNLGRYWSAGPTQTLYIPAPLLKTGINEVVIFEQYTATDTITFLDYPILGPRNATSEEMLKFKI